MTGVLLLLLFVPITLAMVAFLVFRFLAINYRPRTLVVIGTLWVGTLLYWTFAQEIACKLPASGKCDNGCGFISFLGPLETTSADATTLLTLLCLVFWIQRPRKSLAICKDQ